MEQFEVRYVFDLKFGLNHPPDGYKAHSWAPGGQPELFTVVYERIPSPQEGVVQGLNNGWTLKIDGVVAGTCPITPPTMLFDEQGRWNVPQIPQKG